MKEFERPQEFGESKKHELQELHDKSKSSALTLLMSYSGRDISQTPQVSIAVRYLLEADLSMKNVADMGEWSDVITKFENVPSQDAVFIHSMGLEAKNPLSEKNIEKMLQKEKEESECGKDMDEIVKCTISYKHCSPILGEMMKYISDDPTKSLDPLLEKYAIDDDHKDSLRVTYCQHIPLDSEEQIQERDTYRSIVLKRFLEDEKDNEAALEIAPDLMSITEDDGEKKQITTKFKEIANKTIVTPKSFTYFKDFYMDALLDGERVSKEEAQWVSRKSEKWKQNLVQNGEDPLSLAMSQLALQTAVHYRLGDDNESIISLINNMVQMELLDIQLNSEEADQDASREELYVQRDTLLTLFAHKYLTEQDTASAKLFMDELYCDETRARVSKDYMGSVQRKEDIRTLCPDEKDELLGVTKYVFDVHEAICQQDYTRIEELAVEIAGDPVYPESRVLQELVDDLLYESGNEYDTLKANVKKSIDKHNNVDIAFDYGYVLAKQGCDYGYKYMEEALEQIKEPQKKLLCLAALTQVAANTLCEMQNEDDSNS